MPDWNEPPFDDTKVNDLETARMALRWALGQIRTFQDEVSHLKGDLREKTGRENALVSKTAELEEAVRRWEAKAAEWERVRKEDLDKRLLGEVETLRQAEARHRDQLIDVNRELSRLRDEQAARLEEMERLRQENERFAATKEDRESQLRTLRANSQRWENEAASLATRLVEITHQLSLVQSQKIHIGKLLEAERRGRAADLESIESRLARAKEEEKVRAAAFWEDRQRDWQAKETDLAAKLAALEQDRAAWRARAQELETLYNRVEEERARHEAAATKLRRETEGLAEGANRAETDLRAEQSRRRELEAALKSEQLAAEDLRRRGEDLGREIADLRRRLESESAGRQAAAAEAGGALEAERRSWEQERGRLEQERQSAQAQRQKWEEEAQLARERLAETEFQMNVVREQKTIAEERLAAARNNHFADIEQQKAQMAKLAEEWRARETALIEQEQSRWKARVDDLVERLTRSEQSAQELQTKLATVERALAEVSQAQTQESAEALRWREEAERLSALSSDLQAQVDEQRRAQAENEASLRRLRGEHERLSNLVEDQKVRIEQTVSGWQADRRLQQAELERQIGLREESLRKAAEAAASARSDWDAERRRLQAEKDELVQSRQKAQEAAHQSAEELAQLRFQAQIISDEKSGLEENLARERAAHVADLEKAREHARREAEEFKTQEAGLHAEQVSRLEAERRSLAERAAELERAEAESRTKLSEAEASARRLEEDVRLKDAELARWGREAERLSARVAELEKAREAESALRLQAEARLRDGEIGTGTLAEEVERLKREAAQLAAARENDRRAQQAELERQVRFREESFARMAGQAENKRKEWDNERRRLEVDRDEAVAGRQKWEEEAKRAADQLAEIRFQAQVLADQKVSLEQTLAQERRAHLEDIERQREQLERAAAESRSQESALRAQEISRLEADRRTLTERLAALDKNEGKWKTKAAEAEGAARRLEEEARVKDAELLRWSREAEALSARVQELEKTRAADSVLRLDEESRLREFAQRNASLSEEVARLRKESESLAEAWQSERRELAGRLESERAAHEADRRSLAADFASQHRAFEEKLALSAKESEALRAELAARAESSSEAARRLSALEEALRARQSELERSAAAFGEQKAAWEKERARLEQERAELAHRRQELEESAAAAAGRAEELRVRAELAERLKEQESRDARTRLEAASAAAEEARAGWAARQAELSERLAAQEQAVEGWRKRFADTQSALDNLKEELRVRDAREGESKGEAERLRRALEDAAVRETAATKQREEDEALRRRTLDDRQKFEEESKRLSGQLGEMKFAVSMLEDQRRSLQEALERERQARAADLEAQRAKTVQDVEQWKALEAAALAEEKKRWETRHAEMVRKLSVFEADAASWQSRLQEAEESAAQLRRLAAERASDQARAAEEIERLSGRLAALEQLREAASAERTKLEKTLDAKLIEGATLRQENQELRLGRSQAEADLRALKSSVDEVAAALERREREWEAEKARHEEERAKLSLERQKWAEQSRRSADELAEALFRMKVLQEEKKGAEARLELARGSALGELEAERAKIRQAAAEWRAREQAFAETERGLLEERKWIESEKTALEEKIRASEKNFEKIEAGLLKRRAALEETEPAGGAPSTDEAQDLVFGVAHQIRTPLAVLQNFAESQSGLSWTLNGGALLQTFLRHIDTIKSRLDVATEFLKPLALRKRFVDLRALLEKTFLLVDDRCRSQEVRVEIQVPDEFKRVMADPDQLRTAFLHLIFNALEAMPKGGAIRVSAARDKSGRSIEVRIGDTGPGIDAAKLREAVQPFYTTKPDALGMGLPIARKILRAHGGDLVIESGAAKGLTAVCLIRG